LIETVRAGIEAARDAVEQIKGDEEEYRDNMPESLQSSEKYERADTAVNNLDEAFEALDIDFDDIIGKLNEAQE
jgi:hypothetical protein